MRAPLRFAVLLAVLAALPSRANAESAGGLWVELYTGERPAQADALLQPMRAVFEERGLVGGEALAVEMTAVSRPGLDVPKSDVTQLAELVELGYSLLSAGKYASAAERLQKAIDIAKAAQSVLVRNDTKRDVVVKALLGLGIAYRRDSEDDAEQAKSLKRKKLQADAAKKLEQSKEKRRLSERAFEDAVRFSTDEPDPYTYGTQPVTWWKEARERLQAAGTGTLMIDPGDAGVTSFVNTAYAGQGATEIELLPGEYQVYSHRADVPGRVYTVEVVAQQVTRLEIDWDFDAALHTERGVWFSFSSAEENRELRARIAAQTAKTAKVESQIVLVGLSVKEDGSQYAYGVTFDSMGKVVASGEALLGEEDSAQRLQNLARLLTGDSDVSGVDRFDTTTAPAEWRDVPPPQELPQRAEGASPEVIGGVSATVLSAGAVVSLGAGLYWSAINEQCIGDDVYCRSIHFTKRKGIAAVTVGVFASGAAGYLWGRQRRDERRLLHGAWPWVIGSVSAGAVILGAGLIAIHDPIFIVDENGVSLTPTYRPTLLPGAVVATVGALGLGFSIYSAMGSSTGRDVTPTLSLSGDGGTVGLAGRF